MIQYNLEEADETNTLLADTKSLDDDDIKSEPTSAPYRSLVGSLPYGSIMTRPDILKATMHLSKYNNNPLIKHWKAAKHVARYL